MLKNMKTLNVQILTMLVVLLVLPLLAVGIFLFASISQDLVSIDRERLQNYNVSSQELLSQAGSNVLDLGKSYSYWEDFRSSVKAGDAAWIEENVLTVPDVVSTVHFAAVAGLDGKILHQTRDAEGFTQTLDPKLVEQFKQTENFHTMVASGDRIALLGVSKITDEEGTADPTGMLIFGRYVDEAVLSGIHSALNADVAFVSSASGYMGIGETASEELFAEHLEQAASSSNTVGYEDFRIVRDGNSSHAQIVSTLKGMSDQPLGLLYISLPLNVTAKVMGGLLMTYSIVGLILLITIAIFTVWLRQRVVKPLQHVAEVLEITAQGTLTERIDARYSSRRDEIGKLAASFERMRESFRTVTAGVYSLAAALSTSSQELAETTEQSQQDGQRMNEQVREMALGAQTQLQSTEESAKSMQEMAIGVGRIAESAGSVTDMSVKTTQLSREGSASVNVAIHGMDSITGSVQSSAQIIRQLHEHTQNIGEIVGMVQTIAKQTNLLALNAAIEAARAGEAGRGFAVVAAEVRKLAEQSAASIGQITELLDSIRHGADQSVSAMEQVSADVERGSAAMSGVTALFAEIQSAMENVSEQIQEVSAVAEQLSAGSEEVSATVAEMADVSAGTASRTQEVLQITEGQSSAMSRISESMSALNQTAQELQQLVKHMKV